MSVQIDLVRVAGFRGLNNVELSLSKTTVLIGTNNSGKTSMLKAMGLALGDYYRLVSEEDLFIDDNEKRAAAILVDVRVLSVDKDGKRVSKFTDEWVNEFGDNIRQDASGNQYLAVRTRCFENSIKGGFVVERFALEKWPDFATWNTEKIKEKKMSRLESIPLISIEAQRDIHNELRAKSSYIGKVLSELEYDKKDIDALEAQINSINNDAVAKSSVLVGLKGHLENLSDSFAGSGKAEVTPFPKKIRDLSKNFSVHVGGAESGTFPMEYHGMGTRSWASMLTVKAFTDLMSEKHQKEVKPFFPVVAAEEPEAHLHPSAQKTLYKQLATSKGQTILSTHSPYLASLAEQTDLRYLRRFKDGVKVSALAAGGSPEEHRKIKFEVIESRGEILFANAIVLSEGETEQQALPVLFRKFFQKDPFEVGVSFVGVRGAGARYLPFLKLAKDFSIPIFIFSDGETGIVADLKKNYEIVFGTTDINNCKNITVLPGQNYEEYLIGQGFAPQAKAAIEKAFGTDAVEQWIKKRDGTKEGQKASSSPPCGTCKRPFMEDVKREYTGSGREEKAILEMLSDKKAKLAPLMAEEISALSTDKFPIKVVEFFEKMKEGAKFI